MNDRATLEETLLLEALALPPGERHAFIDRRCGTDLAAAERLVALLRGYQDNSAYLEIPAPTAALRGAGPALPAFPPEPEPGERIGRYFLRQRIGEGGCGVVFLAEQEEPVRRSVALKVIRLGLDTREFIKRFEAERQALAVMDHPNIARVFDAGATDRGRPYLVMELIRGVPLTAYCDDHRLPIGARLGLFLQVCGAIQHAHQKGVIHCDLKPSNILIEPHDPPEAGCPKVIDFGIAKATPERRADETLFTLFPALIGTPAYTSPEQMELNGGDVDTRSDIYALGVLLYELLTGHPPFDAATLDGVNFEEMRRLIREVDPARPSVRAGTLAVEERTRIAQSRGLPPEKLSARLRSDLDWIVMRCLEKDRARRYETANGLAMDLRRHLACEPVVARPPTGAYRLEKFVRRHRTWVVAGSTIAVALLAGLVLAAVGFARARLQQHAAESARREAESLVSFMVEDLHPELLHAGRLPLTTQVAERAVRYFATLPAGLNNAATERNRAIALETLAWVRSVAGNKAAAAALWHEALAARRRAAAGAPGDPLYAVELARTEFVDVSQAYPLVAAHAWGEGSPETDARLAAIVERAREACRRHLHDGRVARSFAQLLVRQSDYLNARMIPAGGALTVAREAEALYRDFLARSPDDTSLDAEFVRLLVTISIALQQSGHEDGGIEIAREALVRADRALAKNPGNLELRETAANTATQFAFRVMDATMERASAAEAVARERWRELVRMDPENYTYRYQFAFAHAKEAEFLYASGRKTEAGPVLERYVALFAPVARSPDDFQTLRSSEFKLAALAAQLGRRDASREHLNLAPAWHAKYLASLSPEAARQPWPVLGNLEGQCNVLELLGDWPALEQQARALLETATAARRADPFTPELRGFSAVAEFFLGRALLGQNRAAQAVPVLRSATDGFAAIEDSRFPREHLEGIKLMVAVPLAEASILAGDVPGAREQLERTLVAGEALVAANPKVRWDWRVALAESKYLLAGQLDPLAPADAARRHALLEQAAATLERRPADSPLTVRETELLAKIDSRRAAEPVAIHEAAAATR